jgi:peptidyl-prolyl cis-trans isomerase A (cyclophilin A)
MKKLVLALAVLAAVGCKKKKEETVTPATTDTAPSATPPAGGGAGASPRQDLGSGDDDAKLPVVVAPAGSDDPYQGKVFSVAEATQGLPAGGKLMAEITVKLGTMKCELYPDQAPETVASFVGLARGKRPWKDPNTGEWKRSHFFDGLIFHRVIPEFMIQGGDPQGTGTGGPGYTLPDEIAPSLKFDRGGRLAMANKGPQSHTGGSQFFITEGVTSQLDGGYVIFGQCDGVDVVKAVARVPRNEMDRPLDPIPMTVRISRQ